MKSFEDCVNISLKENGYIGGENIPNSVGFVYKEAAKAYAQQVAEDVRQRCLENAEIFHWQEHGFTEEPRIIEESILNTEIILP